MDEEEEEVVIVHDTSPEYALKTLEIMKTEINKHINQVRAEYGNSRCMIILVGKSRQQMSSIVVQPIIFQYSLGCCFCNLLLSVN